MGKFDESRKLSDGSLMNCKKIYPVKLKNGEEIMEIFEQLHTGGNTIILITHEEYIANHSNRVVRLLDGVIQSDEVTRQAN